MPKRNEDRSAKPGHKPPTRPPVEITELSQLEKISHGEPIICDVIVRGQPVRLVGRRLKPLETKEIKLLLDEALPPLLPPEKEGAPARYDFRDPGYLKRSEDNRRIARALALYSAFPVFRAALEKEGGPVDCNRIVQFIENRELEDDVLELLFERVIERVVGLAPYVGFS